MTLIQNFPHTIFFISKESTILKIKKDTTEKKKKAHLKDKKSLRIKEITTETTNYNLPLDNENAL